MQSQNLNPKSVKEIVDFINQTSCQTDMNLFERLNSDELLNIYINCLIFLGAANDYNDFELNENEENLFATVVKENKALKVIKVSALINNLFKKFGHVPNFSPVNIFSPNVNSTFSTLMRLLFNAIIRREKENRRISKAILDNDSRLSIYIK